MVFEIEYILKKLYKVDISSRIILLTSLISSSYINTQIESGREILLEILTIYKSKNLALTDCFLIATAKRFGYEVFTFDKDLLKVSN